MGLTSGGSFVPCVGMQLRSFRNQILAETQCGWSLRASSECSLRLCPRFWQKGLWAASPEQAMASKSTKEPKP